MSNEDLRNADLSRKDAIHRLTFAGAFTANAYSNDVFAVGVEYSFKQYAMFRAGYTYESGQFDVATSKTFYTAPSVGVSFGIPMNVSAKKDAAPSILFIDYGYRFTNRWQGNHYIGLKIDL